MRNAEKNSSSCYACPKCGQREKFTVACIVSLKLDPETQAVLWPTKAPWSDIYWDNGNEMTCGKCDHSSRVRDFLK